MLGGHGRYDVAKLHILVRTGLCLFGLPPALQLHSDGQGAFAFDFREIFFFFLYVVLLKDQITDLAIDLPMDNACGKGVSVRPGSAVIGKDCLLYTSEPVFA